MSKSKSDLGFDSLFKGHAAEDEISAMFKRWHWIVGKPTPDIGADLVVEIPSAGDGFTAAFLVQVKSTGKNKAITLKHTSARRLRESVLPTFLFCLNTTNANVVWTYLEPLFNRDSKFKGGGPLVVRPQVQNAFVISDPCPVALMATLRLAKARGSFKAGGTIATYAEAEREFFREIDPRVEVTPTFDGKRAGYAIRTIDEQLDLRVNLRAGGASSAKAFHDLIGWGLSGTLEECSVEVVGSEVFKHFGLGGATGRLDFVPDPLWSGSGLLAATGSPDLPIDLAVHQGELGSVIELVCGGGAVRFQFKIARSGEHIVNLTADFAVIAKHPASELHRLKGLTSFLDALFDEATISIRFFNHPTINEPLAFKCHWRGTAVPLGEERYALKSLEALGYIQSRLGALPTAVVIESSQGYEMQRWIDVAEILKGERVFLRLKQGKTLSTPYEGSESFPVEGKFRIKTTLPVRVGDKTYYEVGALINCDDFKCERVPESADEIRFIPLTESSALYLTAVT
jgi:hypothetical protein